MRTSLRKIGNSKGVIIPAAMLSESGLSDTVELRLEGARLVIEPVKAPRSEWFSSYDSALDEDPWSELSPGADSDDWEW
jgi:antitoxin MazE